MPPTVPEIRIGDAVTAAGRQQYHRSLRGYGHVSGGPAQAVGDLNIEVPSDASVWIDGTEVGVSTTGHMATVEAHPDLPRWATIVVEDTGNVRAINGDVNRPRTVDNVRVTGRQAPRPQPPVVTDPSQTVYAFVWVPSNASAIEDEHVVDRRIDARLDAYNFSSDNYTDGDAVDAVEAASQLDLGGSVSVAGDLSVAGAYQLAYDGSTRDLLTANDTDQFGNSVGADRLALLQRTSAGTSDLAHSYAFGQGVHEFYDESGNRIARFDSGGASVESGDVTVDSPGGAEAGTEAAITSDGDDPSFQLATADGSGNEHTRWSLSADENSYWLEDVLNGIRGWTVDHDGANPGPFRAAGPVQMHGTADYAVYVDGSEMEIQKNGTDGTGIINFKE